MPETGAESWTLLGSDHAPVEPVERWLAHLTSIERSPNTVNGYAHDLKDWFTYLTGCGLDWRMVRLEDVGGFVAWLRLPPEARDDRVLVLPSVEHQVKESSANRKLSALSSFYQFHARHGIDVGELLLTLGPSGRRGTSWRPFLHHVSKGKPAPRRTIKLTAPTQRPQILTARQVQAILDACEHLRDRLLFATLYDTGVRIGEALGVRHEDLAIAERELHVTPRRNHNRARVKSGRPRTIPVSGELVRKRGFCGGHHQRWSGAGRPELAGFIASVGQLRGRCELRACDAPGCRYGSERMGLCRRHHRAWRRAGQPDRMAWLAGLPEDPNDAPDHAECRLRFCGLLAVGQTPFCYGHMRRWCDHGPARPRGVRARLRTLRGRLLRLSAAHRPAQARAAIRAPAPHDDRRTRIRSRVFMGVARAVAMSGVASLLDWSEERWREQLRPGQPHGTPRRNQSQKNERSFVVYARRELELLRDGCGWEAQFPRDVWRVRLLGFQKGSVASLRFDRIPQPWLRELAKRWIRWRLASGRSASQAAVNLQAVTRFAGFLALPAVAVDRLGGIDRSVLERYLADLAHPTPGLKHRAALIGSLNLFFQAIRQHQWAPDLPTTAAAVFFPEDYPKQPQRLPRFLAETVMAQVEHPDNLNRWPDPAGRLLTVILIRCGLRVGDACRLPLNCTMREGGGAPYLRYVNHKMRREALVPIDEELALAIDEQRQRVLRRWPAGAAFLFPQPKANADGRKPLTTSSYRGQLDRWLAACDIRDERGQPVRLTPHQWRHTFATRLINRDVPQEVVRILLDHDSTEMTAHYARISDQTTRRHWEQARKVNIHGEQVKLEPDSPLADAQWIKHRVGLATQALPNGYCGLPIQKACPHANACLTCPVFITTPDFLDQHRRHREQTRRLIKTATANGQLRLAEMNQRVVGNLDRIITKLEAGEDLQVNLGTASDAS